ncbi:monovalent cation/H(+) antiporter subunit G [Pseudonocardia acidicola]|uniref:Multisubunit sodium/proton antiporter MrpG subunit n=1 Tax=Pseudonocardia acidicola TaxID=2724939 RepID=A0ABX1S4C4_9PSEU|nr:hypothetical protein [Pseudonocardia acidicola]
MIAAEAVLLGIAVLATALSGAGLCLIRDRYVRLHFLAPAATIGAPCVSVAVILQLGGAALLLQVLLIGLLVVAGGAVATAAVGRATAQRDGTIDAGTDAEAAP